MSLRSASLSFAIALLALGSATVAQAETVVLQASGPSAPNFATGAVLLESERITLVQGDTLRLLVAGSTRIISGPFSGPARAYQPEAPTGALWDGVLRPKPRTRAAATRGFIPAALPKN